MDNWKLGLFGPDGGLTDFQRRVGDPALPVAHPLAGHGAARRWGKAVRLTVAGVPQPVNAATLIETGDLGQTYPIQLRFRFAPINPSNVDEAPVVWSRLTPALLAGTLTIKVRRGTDPNAPVGVTESVLALGTASDTPDFDVVMARNLGVDVRIVGAGLWVECVATEVHVEDYRDRIVGWTTVNPAGGFFVAAVASPANVLLMNARKARVGFTLVNTSTNADMIVNFGTGASWVGPVGSIVLPAGSFSSFSSGFGGFNGDISASWNAAVPNGGILVTEYVFSR